MALAVSSRSGRFFLSAALLNLPELPINSVVTTTEWCLEFDLCGSTIQLHIQLIQVVWQGFPFHSVNPGPGGSSCSDCAESCSSERPSLP